MAESNPQPQDPSQQGGQRRMTLRIDESKLNTGYTNAFRTHVTPDEVVLDVGMNMATPGPQGQTGEQGGGGIVFQVNHRMVMTPATTKRMALLLAQIVRQHEQQFGEIKLNPGERRPPSAQS